MKHPKERTGRDPCRHPEPKLRDASDVGSPEHSRSVAAPRGLNDRITWVPVSDLKPFPGNPRRHPEAQIVRLMRSIKRVWTNPILIDDFGTILAGHGRLEAAKRLGRSEVPTLTIAGLGSAEKRAIVIADNRLPEQALWDFDLLREHFKALIDLDFDVELTGFSTGEADLLLDGKPGPAANDPADDLTDLTPQAPAISQLGDVWELGRHRLICGDALQGISYEVLLRGALAQTVIADAPYNLPIGHAVGRGKVRRHYRSALETSSRFIIRSSSREGPVSARGRRRRTLQRRSVDRTDSRRSASAVGASQDAPEQPFAS